MYKCVQGVRLKWTIGGNKSEICQKNRENDICTNE